MNEKHLFLRGRTYGWLLATSVMLFGACTDAIEPETWDPGVSNVTLAAPEVADAPNAKGDGTILSWPVVYGAGGFQLSLYDVTTPDAPITIFEDSIIDGHTCTVPREDDTAYKLVVQTLGNEKYNNLPSEKTEYLFTTIVPKIHENPIPGGTDLSVWLADNKSVIESQTEEFAVELTAGQTYKMSTPFYLGKVPFTLRSSSKTERAYIEMGETAGFIIESGIKIKRINFDCTNMTSKTAAIIAYPKEPTVEAIDGYYVIGSSEATENTPVVLQQCNIKALKTNLFYDSGTQWTVFTEMITDCIIELDQAAMDANGAHIFNNSKGMSFHTTIENSTIYSTTQSRKSFLITYTGKRPDQIANGKISPTCDVNVLNNTFVNVAYKNSICNYGRLGGRNIFTIQLKFNIFLDCGNNRVGRDFCGNGNGNENRDMASNNFWYNGAIGDTNRKVCPNPGLDPQFTQTEEGIFMVGNPELNAGQFGDPRGLTIIEEN